MSDSTIANLTQAQQGYVDATDELVVQKSGETQAKKVQINDIFGGWRDLVAPITSAKVAGGSTPTWTQFNGGANYQYAFAVGNEVWLTFHIDHDMEQGALMYPHMHWTTNGTSTNTVKWEIKYTMAKGHNQETFGGETTVTVEEAASGIPYQHMVTEDTVGVATPEPDTVVLVHLKRITNGGTDNTDTVFGITFDWHYPTQMYATKNRTPNFYS